MQDQGGGQWGSWWRHSWLPSVLFLLCSHMWCGRGRKKREKREKEVEANLITRAPPSKHHYNFSSVSVQSLRHVRLFATPWTTARQASLSITNSWSLLKLMSIELVMPSSHLILCHPLLLLSSIPSQHQGLFQWVNSSHQVAKVLEFQLQHQSFQWTPRTDLL